MSASLLNKLIDMLDNALKVIEYDICISTRGGSNEGVKDLIEKCESKGINLCKKPGDLPKSELSGNKITTIKDQKVSVEEKRSTGDFYGVLCSKIGDYSKSCKGLKDSKKEGLRKYKYKGKEVIDASVFINALDKCDYKEEWLKENVDAYLKVANAIKLAFDLTLEKNLPYSIKNKKDKIEKIVEKLKEISVKSAKKPDSNGATTKSDDKKAIANTPTSDKDGKSGEDTGKKVGASPATTVDKKVLSTEKEKKYFLKITGEKKKFLETFLEEKRSIFGIKEGIIKKPVLKESNFELDRITRKKPKEGDIITVKASDIQDMCGSIIDKEKELEKLLDKKTLEGLKGFLEYVVSEKNFGSNRIEGGNAEALLGMLKEMKFEDITTDDKKDKENPIKYDSAFQWFKEGCREIVVSSIVEYLKNKTALKSVLSTDKHGIDPVSFIKKANDIEKNFRDDKKDDKKYKEALKAAKQISEVLKNILSSDKKEIFKGRWSKIFENKYKELEKIKKLISFIDSEINSTVKAPAKPDAKAPKTPVAEPAKGTAKAQETPVRSDAKAQEASATKTADVKGNQNETTAAEAAKKAEEEAAKKKAAEEAARKKAEEEEEAAAKKKAAEETARKKAEEEAAAKKKAEEEAAAKKKAEEEAAAKKKAEKEAAEEAEEEAARKKAEEEAARKKAAEAAAKKKAEKEATITADEYIFKSNDIRNKIIEKIKEYYTKVKSLDNCYKVALDFLKGSVKAKVATSQKAFDALKEASEKSLKECVSKDGKIDADKFAEKVINGDFGDVTINDKDKNSKKLGKLKDYTLKQLIDEINGGSKKQDDSGSGSESDDKETINKLRNTNKIIEESTKKIEGYITRLKKIIDDSKKSKIEQSIPVQKQQTQCANKLPLPVNKRKSRVDAFDLQEEIEKRRGKGSSQRS